MCALSLTSASLCEAGADSKLVLKRLSTRVDLPSPVSPMHITLKVNPPCTDLFTSWSGSESKPTWPPSSSGLRPLAAAVVLEAALEAAPEDDAFMDAGGWKKKSGKEGDCERKCPQT